MRYNEKCMEDKGRMGSGQEETEEAVQNLLPTQGEGRERGESCMVPIVSHCQLGEPGLKSWAAVSNLGQVLSLSYMIEYLAIEYRQ